MFLEPSPTVGEFMSAPASSSKRDPAPSASCGPIENERSATSPARTQTLSSEGVLDALKMILTDAPLNDVLHSVALLIEAHSEGMLCTIYLLDEDGVRLRFAAGPKLPDAYRVATGVVYIGPEVRCPPNMGHQV
jgi:hypothetical protein